MLDKSIVFLSDKFFPMHSRNAFFTFNMSRALKDENKDVSVYTLRTRSDKKQDELDGIKIYRMPRLKIKKNCVILKVIMIIISIFLSLNLIIKISKAKKIYLFSDDIYMQIVLLASRIFARPDIYIINNEIFPEFLKYKKIIKYPSFTYNIFKSINEYILELSSKIILANKDMQRYLLSKRNIKNRSKIEIDGKIPKELIKFNNDIKHRKNAEISELPSDKFIVSHIGDIGESTELETILDFCEIMKNANDVLFVLLYKTRNKNNILEKIKRQNLKNIKLLTIDTIYDLISLLKKSNAFIFGQDKGSKGMTYPYEYLIYLKLAKPIIAAISNENQIGRELRKAKAALCIEPKDAYGLSSLVNELKSSDELICELSKNSIKLFSNRYI